MSNYLPSLLVGALTFIGGLIVTVVIFNILDFVYLHFLAPSKLHRYRHNNTASRNQEAGAWALVTGASDGIGLQLAKELARAKFNVVLHGRNATKLSQRVSDLQSQFPTISFRTAIADASILDTEKFSSQITTIANDMRSLPGPLTVLVNNIGGLSPGNEFQSFSEQAIDDIEATINMNMRFTTRITSSLLPLLKQNAPGLIIVHGSGTGDYGFPFLSVYGATKAYLKMWTQAVASELSIAKVDIEMLGIDTGKVTETAGSKEPATLFVPGANTYAKAILRKVGCGRSWVWASWAHALQIVVFDLLPRRVLLVVIEGMLVEAKKTALEKAEKSRKTT